MYEAKKVKKINWWSNDARKEPIVVPVDVDGDGVVDKVEVVQPQAMPDMPMYPPMMDMPMYPPMMEMPPMMPPMPTEPQYAPVPYIQPLVIVPYSAPANLYKEETAEEDALYEDLYTEDADEYILDQITRKKGKKAKKSRRK